MPAEALGKYGIRTQYRWEKIIKKAKNLPDRKPCRGGRRDPWEGAIFRFFPGHIREYIPMAWPSRWVRLIRLSPGQSPLHAPSRPGAMARRNGEDRVQPPTKSKPAGMAAPWNWNAMPTRAVGSPDDPPFKSKAGVEEAAKTALQAPSRQDRGNLIRDRIRWSSHRKNRRG